MKLAIISDLHDNIANLDIFLAWEKENPIDALLCCGDTTFKETLKHLAKNFSKSIYFVFGNADTDREGLIRFASKFPNTNILGETGRLIIAQNKIIIISSETEKDQNSISLAFIHFPTEAKKLAESGFYDYVFYGHTHKPWLEKIGATNLVNPGTLGGVFYQPTFALLDLSTRQLSLKLLSQLI